MNQNIMYTVFSTSISKFKKGFIVSTFFFVLSIKISFQSALNFLIIKSKPVSILLVKNFVISTYQNLCSWHVLKFKPFEALCCLLFVLQSNILFILEEIEIQKTLALYRVAWPLEIRTKSYR